MSEADLRFPPDFTWGVATSSYQIEGASDEDGRGPSIWDTYCRVPGNVAGGATGDVACDHYHRWRQDLDILGDLGVSAYRFSVAWPRILPRGGGEVEPRGLDFYDRLVDGLLERGVEPHATLYHWDLPQALEDEGGWPNRATVDAFTEYADALTRRLGDRVAAYATLNEPWCSAYLGYATGEHAPGRTDPADALQAAHHLLLAHGRALEVMRANAPASRHGIVLNFNPAYPARNVPGDHEAVRRYDAFFNRWYLEPLLLGRYPAEAWEGFGGDVPEIRPGDLETIRAPLDFLGVNYYSRVVLEDAGTEARWPAARAVSGDGPRTAMGWEVYPRGLTDLLVWLAREYATLPPMYVTENGAAYTDRLSDGRVHDAERTRYLRAHVDAVADALALGVDVRGYFAWSLLDNFEWARGYDKRFGVVHVDFADQTRTVKDSGRWYRDLILRERRRAPTT